MPPHFHRQRVSREPPAFRSGIFQAVAPRLPAALGAAVFLFASPVWAQGGEYALGIMFSIVISALVFLLLAAVGVVTVILNLANRQRSVPITLGCLLGVGKLGWATWLAVQLKQSLDAWRADGLGPARFHGPWALAILFMACVGLLELVVALRATRVPVTPPSRGLATPE